MKNVEDIIRKQLEYEFDLKENHLHLNKNIFSTKVHDDNFLYNNRSKASIISFENKLLVRSEDYKLLNELEEKYKKFPGQWFLEAKNIDSLREILNKYSLSIKNIFPVFIPKFVERPSSKFDFKWLNEKDFEKLKKDKRYNFVFTYEKGELGISYKDKGKLIALGSASPTASYFYDIGLEKYDFDIKYKTIGQELLKYLTYSILTSRDDRIPICSTQFSHTKSLNMMMNSGYRIGFTDICID